MPLSGQPVAGFTAGTQARSIPGSWRRLAAEFTCSLPAEARELRVNFDPLGQVILKHDQLRILDASGTCWGELPAELPPAQAVQAQLFIEEDMVELFVRDRYSLAARLPAGVGPLRLSFQTDQATALLSALRMSGH